MIAIIAQISGISSSSSSSVALEYRAKNELNGTARLGTMAQPVEVGTLRWESKFSSLVLKEGLLVVSAAAVVDIS